MTSRRKARSLPLQGAAEPTRHDERGATGWFVLGRGKSPHVPLATAGAPERDRACDWFAPRKLT